MNGQLRSWLKPVANKKDYISALKAAIWRTHHCAATYRETVPVHETFQGKTVWKGDVEVFDLTDHPKAKRAYAWAHLDGDKDDKTRFWAVIELPPVKDAKTAVQAAIMADSPKPQSRP
jgi:hypothetical protein